jgi:hypothetical protein
MHWELTVTYSKVFMWDVATSWEVAGSIPDVTRIFHRHNPSGRTVALGSTQALKEMSSRDIYWGGKDGRFLGLTT